MPPPFYGIIRAFPTPNTPFSDLTFFLSLPLEVSGLKYMLSLLQGSYQVWKGQVFDQVVTYDFTMHLICHRPMFHYHLRCPAGHCGVLAAREDVFYGWKNLAT